MLMISCAGGQRSQMLNWLSSRQMPAWRRTADRVLGKGDGVSGGRLGADVNAVPSPRACDLPGRGAASLEGTWGRGKLPDSDGTRDH